MDNLDFLDAGEPAKGEAQPVETVEAPAETIAPEAEPAKAERPRGADGKFVAKETAPAEATATQVAAQTAEPTVPEGMVPVGVLKELREELKALKAAQVPQPAQPEITPDPMPDVFENPEGYAAWQQRQIVNVSLNFSERFAVKEHGKEAVEAAKQWALQKAQSNPSYGAEFMASPDPYDKIVTDWKRETAFSKIDVNEIDAFVAWKQAQASLQPQPAATPNSNPTPTSSIASSPSAGGVAHQAVGPGVAFDETIR